MIHEKKNNESDYLMAFTLGDSPTFSRDYLKLPSIVGIYNLQNFDTNPIAISSSDKILEYEKTSDAFSKFWKQKILSEITVRSDHFLKLSQDQIGNMAEFIPKESLMESIFLHEDLKNWLNYSALSNDVFLPPIRGFEIKEKSKFEIFVDALSPNFKIKDLLNLEPIFTKISSTTPDFVNRIQKIIHEANEFFVNKGISTQAEIVGDIDYDDEKIQNIKVVFSINDLDVSTNLELSQELITYLAGIDKDILENMMVQLQSA